jgi:hypothetical protein
MKVEDLRRNIRKVAALMEMYEEIEGKEAADLESKRIELGVMREQIVQALISTKRVLLEMERETKNV